MLQLLIENQGCEEVKHDAKFDSKHRQKRKGEENDTF